MKEMIVTLEEQGDTQAISCRQEFASPLMARLVLNWLRQNSKHDWAQEIERVLDCPEAIEYKTRQQAGYNNLSAEMLKGQANALRVEIAQAVLAVDWVRPEFVRAYEVMDGLRRESTEHAKRLDNHRERLNRLDARDQGNEWADPSFVEGAISDLRQRMDEAEERLSTPEVAAAPAEQPAEPSYSEVLERAAEEVVTARKGTGLPLGEELAEFLRYLLDYLNMDEVVALQRMLREYILGE